VPVEAVPPAGLPEAGPLGPPPSAVDPLVGVVDLAGPLGGAPVGRTVED
jgi:hypothetical protein